MTTCINCGQPADQPVDTQIIAAEQLLPKSSVQDIKGRKWKVINATGSLAIISLMPEGL